ncbi:MAG: 23S rRNA (guanosine(2251)-2'-O)-methyltransferase RlmB [Chloroflexota bacterium]
MADRPRTPRPGGFRPGGARPGGSRPGGPRPGGSGGPRRSGPGGGGGGFTPRPDGDRSQRDFNDRPRRDFPDRPQRDFGDHPRPSYGDRPKRDFSDRPRRDFNSPASERPRRNFEDRPRRDFSDRPQRDFGNRPQGNFSDRPQGNFSDRPQRYQGPGPRQERTFDRPERGFGRPVRSFDTRRPRISPASDTGARLGEGEELIAGKRPVEEAFAARREALRLLIVPERRAALDALAIHATTLRIPVIEVEGGSLTALAGFDGHQGVALVVKPRAQADVDTILAHARGRRTAPFILILDSLEDPQNFGTLLRSAEACGVDGVIYPTRRAAPLTAAAIKASAGATEHLLLAPVDDLAGTLADLHTQGLRVVGADENASLSYAEADLRGPIALVVGSEGKGMSGPVKRRLDLAVRIPMRGKIESLNAAVAGSILLFAAAQQRPAEVPSANADQPQDAQPAPEPTAKESEPKPMSAKSAKSAKPKRTQIVQVDAALMDGGDEGLLP